MNKHTFVTLIFLFVVIGIILFNLSEKNKKLKEISVILTRSMEKAYFEGQHDAIAGDVRIGKNADSCWVWTKSCWDDGKIPVFDPCKEFHD